MSNSKLVTYTKLSPNKTSPRNHIIDTITIHCYAGQVTAKSGCNGKRFVNYNPISGASCNYVVGYDGSIGMCVEEKDRSWCSSNRANDHRAITIEVASDTTHPYAVTDAAFESLITLCVDICRRNGIKKLIWSTNKKDRVKHLNGCNMTVHRDFAAKACPGDYLYNLHGQIAKEVNEILGVIEKPKAGVAYKVKITASSLNVRRGPGTRYQIATTVKKNEVYTIVEENGNWGKLKSGAGWISLNYTKKV